MRWMASVALAIGLSTASAEIRSERLEHRDGDAVLFGQVYFDDAQDVQRPGVLVIHEWWGQNDYARGRARQLAEMGYVALAADMYGQGRTTTEAAEAAQLAGALYRDPAVLRARAGAALAALKAHPRVDGRVAAIGYCFGGASVLELARSGADLRGVVSFHGSLASGKPAAAGDLRAAVLVCHGADDPLVSAQDIAGFIAEMQGSGADWQMISYGRAVHSFTNPDAGRAGIDGVAYSEPADRRSWADMRQFFDEIFAAP